MIIVKTFLLGGTLVGVFVVLFESLFLFLFFLKAKFTRKLSHGSGCFNL